MNVAGRSCAPQPRVRILAGLGSAHHCAHHSAGGLVRYPPQTPFSCHRHEGTGGVWRLEVLLMQQTPGKESTGGWEEISRRD